MALEVELEVLKSVVNKLDSSLEKISEVSNSIGRLLAVHDERIDQLEKVSERRSDEIEKLHTKLSNQTREIVEKIEKLEKSLECKIKESSKEMKDQHDGSSKSIQSELKTIDERVHLLERWRWYVLGASAAAGYALGNIANIIKLFK